MSELSQATRSNILEVLRKAIAGADPGLAVRSHLVREDDQLHIFDVTLDLRTFRKVVMIGAGKASATMAGTVEDILAEKLTGGLICVKTGYGADLSIAGLVEAGHPVPDNLSLDGALRTLELMLPLRAEDLVICLLSGGASSVWCLPAEGIVLEDSVSTTTALLDSGADIHEINSIRKHISAIKGGLLARAAHPATMATLAVSDVIGNILSTIGSGPTVPDPTTFGEALAVVKKYGIVDTLPVSVITHLRDGQNGTIDETPRQGDPAFVNNIAGIIASNEQALETAERTGRELGYETRIMTAELAGEARLAGRKLAGIALGLARTRPASSKPLMLLGGGETTVTVTGNGRGGRNQELALAAGIELDGTDGIVIASIGTDGTDGPTDAAGAFADGATVERARGTGRDPALFLENNDSYGFFEATGDLIRTGPTGTNVMDLQVIVIDR